MHEAARIRRARELAGMSQTELAARAGTHQPNVSAFENGSRVPSPDMLDRLLEAAAVRPSEVVQYMRDQIIELAASRHARDVRVFGSVARGEDTPDSDIDLLVSFDEGASLLDQSGLVLDLQELLGLRVDVVSERALLAGEDDDIRRDARAL